MWCLFEIDKAQFSRQKQDRKTSAEHIYAHVYCLDVDIYIYIFIYFISPFTQKLIAKKQNSRTKRWWCILNWEKDIDNMSR